MAIINWARRLDGPLQPGTNVACLHDYRTTVDTGSGLVEVVVRVGDLAKGLIGRIDKPETEDLVKRCVLQFIEDYYAQHSLNSRHEHLIDEHEMQRLLDRTLQHS